MSEQDHIDHFGEAEPTLTFTASGDKSVIAATGRGFDYYPGKGPPWGPYGGGASYSGPLLIEGKTRALWIAHPDYLAQNSDGSGAVANGDPVGYLADLSGMGNHLTQSTTAKKPTYNDTEHSSGFLKVDGGDYLENTAGNDIFGGGLDATGIEGFYAMEMGNDAGVFSGDRHFFRLFSNDYPTTQYGMSIYGRARNASSLGEIDFTIYGSTNRSFAAADYPNVAQGTANVRRASVTSANFYRNEVDGVNKGSGGATTWPSPQPVWNNFTLFGNAGGLSTWWADGGMFAVGLYTDLTTDELNQVRTAMGVLTGKTI